MDRVLLVDAAAKERCAPNSPACMSSSISTVLLLPWETIAIHSYKQREGGLGESINRNAEGKEEEEKGKA